jgi:hypothetical protein
MRRTNHPAQEKLLTSLWRALDACQEYADDKPACDHEEDLDCVCPEMHGMPYSLEVFADLLSSSCFPFPEMARRELRRVDSMPPVVESFYADIAAEAPPDAGWPGVDSDSRNHPAHVKAMVALNDALDACQELLDAHGDDCTCSVCYDAEGMRFDLEIYLSALESRAYTWERRCCRHLADTPALVAAKGGAV